jgi:hypothetical protein
MNKTKKSFIAVAAVMVLAIGVSAPVSAAESTTAGIMDALANVTSGSKAGSTSLMTNVGDFKETREGSMAFSSKYESSEVRLPKSTADSIEFLTSKGARFGIRLPFSASAAVPAQIASGIIAYENKNATVTVPIAKTDGSLQLTTVIENPEAPSNYEYQFTLPKGSKIVELGEGVALMDGLKFLGAIAAPWAKDAKGRDVPTHYEVAGTTVTQVVEHLSERFEYPIVADPWLGFNLFSAVYIAPWVYKSQPVVNLNLSPWGWAVYSGIAQGSLLPPSVAAGQAILNTAGWDEAWSKGGTVRTALDKPSQRQQFACHALGAIAAGEWNIEKARPNRSNGNWGAGVAFHHCNWIYAEGSESD